MIKAGYFLTTCLTVALAAGGLLSPAQSNAQVGSRHFPETGKTVKGRFLEYWTQNGGLPQQGFPISDEMSEKSDTDGKTYTVQYFERAVFELHPENTRPFDVLLSLLGNSFYKQKYPGGAPNQKASTQNATRFSQTNKSLGGRFREYWEQNGGLAQQGFPISEEFQERSDLNGKTYTVQYFERAVFELHPENQPPFDVLLSQLGTFQHRARYVAGRTPIPAPTTPPAAQPGWSQITTANKGPAARYDHSAIFDPARDQLVIFGGRGAATLGDTWILDMKTRIWREVRGAGPSPRFGQGTVHDPANRRMIVVMGEGSGFFNDVWVFDLDKETWRQVKGTANSPSSPRTRYGQSAVLDAKGRVIISHGFSDQGRFDDTWAFDFTLNNWVEITPRSGPRPLKRCLHELAYDAANDKMFLFGGCSSGFGPCPQGDLWVLDLKANRWIELAPGGVKPSPRSNPSLAYDARKGEILLYGGKTDSGKSAEAWTYSVARNVWTKVEVTGPTPRSSHATAHDPANNRLLISGGQLSNTLNDEVWEWRY